jgi:hypothetical protein
METKNKIKISSIVESQLPLFVREEYPLVSELLTEYYRSLESIGSFYDLLQNIDEYVKVNNLTNLIEKTNLTSDVDFVDSTINVVNTEGFPKTYGLIKINDEIILYKSKSNTSFNDCVRGFSGITEYSVGSTEEFSFNSTESQDHLKEKVIGEETVKTEVINLSSLFFKEFFSKIKKQFLYGFDNRELYQGINQNLFLKQSKDFYSSKGTDRSFEILFRVLYGKDVEVIKPKNYLIEPSNAQFRVTRNFVVESIQGNIELLLNKTVFQDQYGDIQKSFGTVTDVQKSIRNGKEYYILMLDYDFDKDVIVSGSIFGDLKIHPKTVILDNTVAFSNTLDVDSTIGFPNSGDLVVEGETANILISYEGKTVNQFLNCTGISESIPSGKEISLNTYAYGYDEFGNEIRFRITGVISEANIPQNTRYYEKNDVAKILTLGYNRDYLQDNTWIFNKTVKCEVKSFTSEGEFKYIIETYDDNGIYDGDDVEIEYINSSSGQRETTIINGSNVKIPARSIPGKIFQITTSGFNISQLFYAKRIISRFSNNFISDVLNVYRDFNSEDVYVTSSSLPFYGKDVSQNVEDYKISLSGSFSGNTLKIVNDGNDHGFLTGDAIVYSPEIESSQNNRLNIQSGVYFVKRESETEIKLARSRSDINFGKFISIASTSITNNTLSLLKFSKKNNIPSNIDSQRLIKLLKNPENTGKKYETLYGTTGILINGVELLNYKSDDYFYYGSIKSVDVISSGNNYDIINPPILKVTSETGLSTAKGYCGVEGSLKRIDVIDGGFDYTDTPIITITGGGGKGATALVNMVDYDHYVDFNPTSSNGRLNLISNQIGFSTYHKFGDGESVIYNTGGNTPIGGLTTDAKYYVNVVDDFNIKLHKTLNDSLVGINTVDIVSYGVGNHRFESTIRKKKINSIKITNSGSGYKSKKISVSSSGINTSTNTVEVYDNPFNSGDIIYYYGGGENISGLNTGRYIVTRVSGESFKLSNIGVGSTSLDFYYKTNQYINFKSKGSGSHVFDYEPITVTVSGKVGISTISNVDVTAKVQPIFRGEITSVFVYDGGVGYGSPDIINYNKQPQYDLESGSGAVITPIVSNGKIVNVIINDKGKNYNSPPDLIIRGFGVGALLTPIIQNGQIIDVKIINGGINYDQKNTLIDIVVPGSGCELKFNPQVWTVNRFERLLRTSKFSSNDGVVFTGKNKDYGLQYTHLYSPRALRRKVFSKNIESDKVNYKSDYQNDFDSEKYHSPLLGWAYDGNPIYGPYGYDSPTNKQVRQITSGYSDPIDNQENRPDKKLFPVGYFVEDYQFNNSGDLDEHNGRFCVTPEFPNGTYAYFMTLESIISDSGFFIGNKKPKFPYVIGNSYKSKPIDFNFDSRINQNTFNFKSDSLIRNTKPNNTLDQNSLYEYFVSIENLQTQDSKIKSTTKGTIDSIKIISGGENYKIGDRVIFNNDGSGGTSASAKVEFIKGKPITGISQTSLVISDVEFYPSSSSNRMIGFSTTSHNLKNGDFVNIDSLSNYDKSLENSFNVVVRPDNFILDLGVGNTSVTGLTTYFYISGLLDDQIIRENDILSINSEDIKVLNIDRNSSRIRVLREQNSTVSTSHTAYSILYENPRKFFIEPKTDIKNDNYKLNRELYFNPLESLGIGTSVGIGCTVIFSNPGIGLTYIIIPEKSIYLKDHGLDTGDQLLYKVNSGIGISVSKNGIDEFRLNDGDLVYAAKISKDLIGISTVKVGLGTTGEFVGISQTSSTLFFISPGTGDYHSFQTRFENVSKGNVVRNSVTVSTASTHSLRTKDKVFLDVSSGLTTTVVVKYSDYHRRLVLNPRDFSFVDINDNLITIENHGYSNGQKLIHTSSSPAGGLEDQEIYYAVIYDNNRIRLSRSYYDSLNKTDSIINFTSSSFGTLSQINPKLEITKNQKVIIDLSDSSLSQPFGVGRTSSFDFDLFSDENFSSKYFPVNSNGTSKIVKSGVIGVSSTSKLEFTVDDSFPDSIWYNLIPQTNLNIKKEYQVDSEVPEKNRISFVDSILNGQKILTGVTSNSFVFHNKFNFDTNSYSQTNASLRYYTNSTEEIGEIESIKITSGGKGYERLPSISSVTSSSGSGAILLPESETIGRITSTNVTDIGYNYSIDNTIKPTIRFPTILRVEPLSTIESIDIISPGLNYNTSPDLVVIDSFTNKIVDDIFLSYDREESRVDVIKNTKGLYNVTPRIIAINNSNGLGISSISYNTITKNVRVYIINQFSDPETFPFSVGDNVLIEGISTLESSSKGYNSKNYNYTLFPVVGVQTSLGGSGAYIDYSLGEYLNQSDIPGTFDSENSAGKIIAEGSLPSFRVTLSKNSFINGELIISDDEKIGKVLKFDSKNEFLNVETKDQFKINSLISGESSKSQAFIKEIFDYESFYKIDSSSIVRSGWNSEIGFLNNELQRIQDSEYYQYFSYSLKSEVPIDKWNDVVNNLNHTLGFKKFSDLVLNTSDSNNSGISTSQNDGLFSSICDLNSIVDIECIQDYDLVYENSFYSDKTLTSNEVIFNSTILQDYSESVGNRVLIVDDISNQFNTSSSNVLVTTFNI